MLRKIGIVLVVCLLVIVALAATRPDSFAIQRTTTINAPPETVYSLINDYRKWSAWSPWEKLDPNMTRTFSGADSGVGAVYEWSGNSDVGSGRMEIVEANAPSRIAMRLDFLSPMEAHNTTSFDLAPTGNATNVTWSLNGPQNFMLKLMSVFVNMERMVAPDFERGLANLKAEAEKARM